MHPRGADCKGWGAIVSLQNRRIAGNLLRRWGGFLLGLQFLVRLEQVGRPGKTGRTGAVESGEVTKFSTTRGGHVTPIVLGKDLGEQLGEAGIVLLERLPGCDAIVLAIFGPVDDSGSEE